MRIVALALLCFSACALEIEIDAGPKKTKLTLKKKPAELKEEENAPICQKVQPSEDAHFQKNRLDGVQQPESIADKFDITLCKDAQDSPTGVFHIRKLKGCMSQTEIKDFSDDKKYMEKVMTEMGQDEFIFLLEGPEVHTLHPTKSEKMKKCEYELPFNLGASGRYHVNLVWVRENFKATDEMNMVWPLAHYDLPLGTGVFLNLGSNGHLSLARKQETAKCNLRSPEFFKQQSRWVYQGEKDKLFFEEPKNVRCVDTGFSTTMKSCKQENVIKTVVDYKQYDYLPYSCQPRRFTREEAKTCLAGKKIDFRGDSQMRLMFWTMSSWVYGQHSVNTEEKQKFQKSGGNAGLTHTPQMDNVTKLVPPEDLKDYDLVVANFGHHPADGRHHFSVKKYKELIDRYASKVEDLGLAKSHLMWLETPALPLRMDFAVKSFTDWRTDHRFRMYNEYANEKMASIGVPVIKAYDATQAMSLHAYNVRQGYDLWHYPAEVYMPFIQDVLGVVCDQ